MEQLDPKTLTLLVALIAMIGVIIGGSITIVGNLIAKRQERLAQISKLIAEKRLAAYEEVVTSVRFASLGVGDMEGDNFLKHPLVLDDLNTYHKWSTEYVMTRRRVSHLIDRDLDHKLWVFQNYLTYLGETVGRLTGKDGKYSDQEKAEQFATMVYEDFLQITAEVIEEASKFFNKRIFHSQFRPASLSNKDYKLPAYFSKLALFSRKEDINRLLNP